MRLPILPLLLLVGLLIPVVLTPPSSDAPALAPAHGPLALVPPISNQLAVLEGSQQDSQALQKPPSDVIRAYFNGTLNLVDGGGKERNLSTGSPLWHSNNDSIDYFIYHGEDWNLYEYSKDVGTRKLNLTVEELVHDTPQIKGSVVTVGSKSTTIYYVDADSGDVLSQDHSPDTWPAVVAPGVEEKSLSSNLETSINAALIITIIRTNYFLNSSDLGKPLWSLSTSRFEAYRTHKLANKLGFSQSLPVIFHGEDGNSARAMLPVASDVQPMLHNSSEIEKSYSMGIVPVSQRNTTEAAPSFGYQIETGQVLNMHDDKSIYPTIAGSSFEGENICHARNIDSSMMPPCNNHTYFSTLQNSSKGAFAEKHFSEIFSEVLGILGILGVLSWFTISSLLILLGILALRYLKLRKHIHSDKLLNDTRGQQSVAPKKRKSRKAGNINNDASVSRHDRFKYSEKANAETSCSEDMRSNARYPIINLTRADGAGDGRWVGRLYVSSSEIGRGSNGTVVLEGVYDGRLVAVKRLLRAHHDVALKEIQNLIASDRHPNIVRWHGVEQDLDFIYISLERCSCSLSDLIQLCSDSSSHLTVAESQTSSLESNHKVRLECVKGIDKNLELWRKNGFPSPHLLKLMRDVVSGLAHLHELGIIHRDLKPQNVLISNDRSLDAKLSDMGISKRLLEDMSSLSHHATGYGSSGWQAPEQLLHGRQTRAVDLFSLGCILFFCITKGKHPFGSYFERDSNIINNHIDLFLVDHIPEAINLLSQLLDADPKMRPTALEVLHHPFFWSSEIRLSFLRDTSDRIELEDRENESQLLNELEKINLVAFGGKWGDKLDAAFITDMGRYRKYDFDCTRDLLRVIRNKLNHYRELPKDLQEILGPVPEGFDRYFSRRFPKFLIEVYKVVYRHCKEEVCFMKYFKSSLV